ncbi:hypothetical protein SARC_15779 [Sphaeroforma arctica JP610]|uniref:Uncharacterized protein n=1 Tax=Sphaeroforma arctica JP610 TaxID=667725 RepID=A0A0L0F6A3_9EUKA|nr:hypothetical protein SARC_15779 [Sphaeroforma arctica JP610]KNC71683.1 hypothetical protein SARC_15779 [Sphaeroforma arctica JP610]|eukprot:XP_014145585.1 hypothetical protein SARC_15779 [Sphaeroforma arctica JP610]
MFGPVDHLFRRICDRLKYGRDALKARHVHLESELKLLTAQIACVDTGVHVKLVACANIKRNLEDQVTLGPMMVGFGDALRLIHTESDCAHDSCMEVVVTPLNTPTPIQPNTPSPVSPALLDDAVTEPTTTTSSTHLPTTTTATPIPDTPPPETVTLDDAITGTNPTLTPRILNESTLSGLPDDTVTRKRKYTSSSSGEYRRVGSIRAREYLLSNPKRHNCSDLVSSIGLNRTSGQSVVYKLQKLIIEKPGLFSGLDMKHEAGELKKEISVIIREYYNPRIGKYSLEHKSPLCKALFVKFLIRDCSGDLMELMAFKTLFDECWNSTCALADNNQVG